jgi:hypothetical protein
MPLTHVSLLKGKPPAIGKPDADSLAFFLLDDRNVMGHASNCLLASLHLGKLQPALGLEHKYAGLDLALKETSIPVRSTGNLSPRPTRARPCGDPAGRRRIPGSAAQPLCPCQARTPPTSRTRAASPWRGSLVCDLPRKLDNGFTARNRVSAARRPVIRTLTR